MLNGCTKDAVENRNVFKVQKETSGMKWTNRASEAIVRKCSVEKLFLRIPQNSQTPVPETPIKKRDSETGVFM